MELQAVELQIVKVGAVWAKGRVGYRPVGATAGGRATDGGATGRVSYRPYGYRPVGGNGRRRPRTAGLRAARNHCHLTLPLHDGQVAGLVCPVDAGAQPS